MTCLPLTILVVVLLALLGAIPWQEGHGCLIFHEISHGRGEKLSMLIVKLKRGAVLDRNGITIPCGIRQVIIIK